SENARAHDLFLTRSLRVWMSYFRRHVNSKRGRSGGHFCQRALTLSVRHAFAAEVAQLEMYKRSVGKNGYCKCVRLGIFPGAKCKVNLPRFGGRPTRKGAARTPRVRDEVDPSRRSATVLHE